MKKLISILCTVLLLVSSFSAYAAHLDDSIGFITQDGAVITLTSQELDDLVDIDSDEAKEIAKLFVRDISADNNICWDENTTVVNVVPMYDGSKNNNVTAYTVLFNTGYVVVSAFLDAESLIPEWSDKGSPIYTELDMDTNDKIVYLGGYEYYADNGGDEVTGINDVMLKKSDLINMIGTTRSISNIPESALIEYKSRTASVNDVIVNPVGHANAIYGGSFKYDLRIDYWTNYMDYETTGMFTEYDNDCGPTAITNLMAACRNRYPSQSGSIPSNNSTLFKQIASYGVSNGYYSSNGGTHINTAYNYILGVCSNYGINPYSKFQVANNCTDVDEYEFPFQYNAIFYVSVLKHPIYEDHSVIAYGLSELSNGSGVKKNYFHIADGWGVSPRYLEINSFIKRAVGIQFFY